jgi:hypothetical protein
MPRKRYLAAAPLAVLAALVAVFAWGQLQPKPEGFAPTVAVAADTSTAATAADAPTAAATAVAGPVHHTVDARDKVEWAFFDFESGAVVAGAAFASADWDLAFRRTKLRTNSGVTNPGGPGGAINLGEVALEEAAVSAAVEFSVDALDDEGDNVGNPAIPKWYSYNFVRHVILARENVYLVRTGGEFDALVRFESYYCDDESPGCVTFSYLLVPTSTGDSATLR